MTGLDRVKWFTSVIPATQEVKIRKIMVQGHPEQKVSETLPHLSKQAGHGSTCLSSQLRGRHRSDLRLALGKNARPYLKNS
jgi:hypothetical protein